eukprot:CAMPEP_0178762164 /NCGR_PEP_ID=MMETSP0744-20121128/16391_1 /TAXON_ID=913974 /ORGANISM="Nitzschia punctata, Strain CCMP561" /LENGTH=164 /DNA_ID=CAMNT_0020416813 /DNA_START=185 /DNA_END=675 /DNA_ORIENTATION=+
MGNLNGLGKLFQIPFPIGSDHKFGIGLCPRYLQQEREAGVCVPSLRKALLGGVWVGIEHVVMSDTVGPKVGIMFQEAPPKIHQFGSNQEGIVGNRMTIGSFAHSGTVFVLTDNHPLIRFGFRQSHKRSIDADHQMVWMHLCQKFRRSSRTTSAVQDDATGVFGT